MRATCLVLSIAFTLCGCVDYVKSVLHPWVGAPETELVAKWGYPQSANDIVNVGEGTKVYTYRSYRGAFGAPNAPCAVSFTLQGGYVSSAKYVGANCLEVRR